MSSNSINLVGEFYAMSRLFLEGFEATLTLGNTKGIDILLYNHENDKQFKVEVKTSTSIFNEKIFGGKVFSWMMDKKHEILNDKNLIFCFVFINKTTKEYKLFLVPSQDVAKYCVWEHEHWLKAEHKRPVKNGNMRCFRIKLDETSYYENNFKVFE